MRKLIGELAGVSRPLCVVVAFPALIGVESLAQPLPPQKAPPSLPPQAAERAQAIVPGKTSPTVSLAAPLAGALYTAPASVLLEASATSSSSGKSIVQVEFFAGEIRVGTAISAPYAFTWEGVPAGSYSLTARATDNLGATATSAPVAIVVNAAPSVSLASPANNATFNAPADITLTAEVADPDGTIAQVEFFNGTSLIGTATSPPFSVSWTAVPQGSYSLTARVTDNQGAVTTSTAVAVTVNRAVAQIHFIHTDHLNTPRLITNEMGQVVWSWANDDPFGANVPNENPSGLGAFECNLRLPGQYFDRETGLHYNYFRDYAPNIGRYWQSDPIGLRGGFNTYLYASAGPLTGTDPYGLKTFKICGSESGVKLPDNFGPYSFTQACINHDGCYDDCVKRPTKEECDKEFFADTMSACKDIPFFFRVLGAGRECVDYAFKYSLAVERLGKKPFDEARRKCPPCFK